MVTHVFSVVSSLKNFTFSLNLIIIMDELASKIRFTPIYLYIIQGDISNTHSSL